MAEHFWPAWLKAECRICLTAWSRSARAVTMVAFLPPVSAKRLRAGLARKRPSAVAVPPVRMTALTFGWLTSRPPWVPPGQGTNWSVLRETPARQKHWQRCQATSTVSEAGLKSTVLPAARAAARPPQGMAMGKFHGATTTTTPAPRLLRAGISCHQRAAPR